MIPSPQELGFPEHYQEWRDEQASAIEEGLAAKSRFIGQNSPTGSGKSGQYVAQAVINGGRTIFLTSTKGLQDQLLRDFGKLGMVDIRGKSSYTCNCDPELTCEEGNQGKCHYKGTSMCNWARASFKAKSAPLVVTNYSCWIAANKYGTGFGNFDNMVLDEAHNAPDELARAMQIQISCHEVEEMICRKWPEAGRDSMETWKKWAHVAKLTGELKRDELAASIARDKRPRASHLKQLAHYKNLVHKLADIATCVPQHWVVDEWEKGYQFDPINPAQYGERVLFRGIGRVLLTSATIRPRTLEMIGIPSGDFEFYDYPSNFLPTRSPIYHIPTVKLSHKATEEDIRIWINTVDEICSGRFDRKGIIHVPSFRLRDEILARSLMAPYMMSNFREAKDITSAVVEAFKVAATPSILVSPSVSTGYDFPGDACRYQIIGKVPFPDERGKVAKARKELDKDLGIYQAIQQLVQAAGRGMRSRKDWQEVFILDDNIAWLFWKYREYFPRWFPSFFKTYRGVPNAMKAPVDRRAA